MPKVVGLMVELSEEFEAFEEFEEFEVFLGPLEIDGSGGLLIIALGFEPLERPSDRVAWGD
jgi:hypothetical protein